MAKDHRFGDARRLRYLFGGRAAKTTLREKLHGDADELLAAFLAGHPPAHERRLFGTCLGDLFTHSFLLPALEKRIKSKYLLTIIACACQAEDSGGKLFVCPVLFPPFALSLDVPFRDKTGSTFARHKEGGAGASIALWLTRATAGGVGTLFAHLRRERHFYMNSQTLFGDTDELT
jgi:hypothetical protein